MTLTRAVASISILLASPALGQENQVKLGARADVRYDSNPLRTNGSSGDRRGSDVRYTPAVTLEYARPLGRQLLFAKGDFGYDFYDRYTFLNRRRLEASGGLRFRAGGFCEAVPSASYSLRQSSLNEVGPVVRNEEEIIHASLTAACEKAAGFSPFLSVDYSTASNASLLYRRNDLQLRRVESGFSYARPSLGRIALFGAYQVVDFPNRTGLLAGVPASDQIQIEEAGARFRRDLKTRISGSLEAGYVQVDGRLPITPSFGGFIYEAKLKWLTTARLDTNVSASRVISASNIIGASYLIENRYALDLKYRQSSPVTLTAGAALIDRQVKGVDPVPSIAPRGNEQLINGYGQISYQPLRFLELRLRGSHDERTSQSTVYDYSSTQVWLSSVFSF